jgi:hypothetical protein
VHPTDPSGNLFNVVGVGDFNGDGTSDILWQDSATGFVDEWQISNAQWSASVGLGTHPGSGWTIAGVGDFFGNGITDILWTNVTANGTETDIWELGSGGQWVNSVQPGLHPGSGWSVVGVADFNGDGTDDILWQQSGTGALDEWKMSNGQFAGEFFLGTHPGSGWSVAGTGDFLGNGIKDILFHQA